MLLFLRCSLLFALCILLFYFLFLFDTPGLFLTALFFLCPSFNLGVFEYTTGPGLYTEYRPGYSQFSISYTLLLLPNEYLSLPSLSLSMSLYPSILYTNTCQGAQIAEIATSENDMRRPPRPTCGGSVGRSIETEYNVGN